MTNNNFSFADEIAKDLWNMRERINHFRDCRKVAEIINHSISVNGAGYTAIALRRALGKAEQAVAAKVLKHGKWRCTQYVPLNNNSHTIVMQLDYHGFRHPSNYYNIRATRANVGRAIAQHVQHFIHFMLPMLFSFEEFGFRLAQELLTVNRYGVADQTPDTGFVLDTRYLVLKLSKLSSNTLELVQDTIGDAQEMNAVIENCAVVESDWHIYRKVVDLIRQQAEFDEGVAPYPEAE